MNLDERRVRSKLRVELGRCVSKCRKALTSRKRTSALFNEKAEHHNHVNDRHSEESDRSASPAESRTTDCLVIPKFLQPYSTIGNIKKQTDDYLKNLKIQAKIQNARDSLSTRDVCVP